VLKACCWSTGVISKSPEFDMVTGGPARLVGVLRITKDSVVAGLREPGRLRKAKMEVVVCLDLQGFRGGSAGSRERN